jgi:hypothetical protein
MILCQWQNASSKTPVAKLAACGCSKTARSWSYRQFSRVEVRFKGADLVGHEVLGRTVNIFALQAKARTSAIRACKVFPGHGCPMP